MTTTAVILAGGRGQRVGKQDKGLLPYRGIPLVEHALKQLQPHYSRILISANRNQQTYEQYGYPVIADVDQQEELVFNGPLAGIYAAISQAKTSHVLVYACDLVNIPNDALERLENHKGAADIVVAKAADQAQYLLSIWRSSLEADLADALQKKQLAVYRFLQKHNAKYIEFDQAQWKNLNDKGLFS